MNLTTKIKGDRLAAFLIINGKVYESDCDHQECLEMYYKDAGIKSEFDYDCDGENYDAVKEAAIQKTYALKNAHTAYGFDLFDAYDYDYVLLAHDKKTYDDNLEWMKQYQRENSECGVTIGYFLNNGEPFEAVLTDDCYEEVSA